MNKSPLIKVKFASKIMQQSKENPHSGEGLLLEFYVIYSVKEFPETLLLFV